MQLQNLAGADQLPEFLADKSVQVQIGAELYNANCKVCHGATALGLEEAKLAFPQEHRRCTRCHRPGNPTLIDWNNIQDHDMFDLGNPPHLRGAEALSSFGTAEALYQYLRATMPRYEPSRLEDAEYLDITAFLLELNGLLPNDFTLSMENSSALSLQQVGDE
jgi:mono/diheme cytochrome c family protein